MSVLYPLIQALVLFAACAALGITVWRVPVCMNRRGPGVLQGVSRHYRLLPPERGSMPSGWRSA